MATVLRESPGLSEVQRDHLRTTRSTGEDLLGLISNISYVARLENSSSSLRYRLFSLRAVVEAAADTMATTAQKDDLEVCLVSNLTNELRGSLATATVSSRCY